MDGCLRAPDRKTLSLRRKPKRFNGEPALFSVSFLFVSGLKEQTVVTRKVIGNFLAKLPRQH